MKKLATNIWIHDHVTHLEDGRKLPLRLTAVQLSNKKLWIHAPTPLSNILKIQLSNIGDVGYLFSGNNLHNMFFMDWVETYPQAEAWVTPGIPEKLPNLDNYSVLKENIWTDDFDATSMKEVPKFDETVFYHYASKSLIVTDLVQNDAKRGTYLAPPLLKEGTIQDQKAFKDFITHIKTWDFNRIVVTHGDIVEVQAKQKFRNICELFC
tara:strand:+ start:178 stop:804 length:627 start_codon:yes stop_codon:yes gene_type:complete